MDSSAALVESKLYLSLQVILSPTILKIKSNNSRTTLLAWWKVVPFLAGLEEGAG